MIDQTVTPIVQKPRRIPVNLQDKAEEKVSQLLEQNIIEPFPDNEPRTWVSPPVIAPKPNNDIRFCIDMRLANKAVMRPFTQIPTMEDVTTKFSGAKRYSKLDLKEAYHQFELTPESRNITTFYGPDGLYRYKRLNFGTKSAQDILQIEMQHMLAGIPRQVNLADDILIGGTVDEHDESLQKVLDVLNKNGITVNKKKCLIDVEEVSFVGLVFNESGVKPDPKNVQNLKQVAAPKDMAELRSFLGMAGYSMAFIPNFSQTVHPLWELAQTKRWQWPEECQGAFEKLKAELSEQSLLNHYVPGRETEVIVDASLTGLGAVLVQRASRTEPYRAVVYKSRSLKEVETRYSATEREGLAIRWAVKKLRKYLLGAPPFTIVTDHKPLEFMFNKRTGEVPPRIEKFIMDIQEFDFHVVHRPGKTCIADYLSRHHDTKKGSSPTKTIENEVKHIMEIQVCHAIREEMALTVEEVRRATGASALSQKLIEAIQTGAHSEDPDLRPYMSNEVRPQLSVIDGVICRGSRIVIPAALQKQAVELSHQAHQGTSKTKAFVRTFAWFPGIDAEVERQVSRCLPCQAVQEVANEQPIKPNELPTGPWQYVEMDFQGPYPNGEYIFVIMDRYSRWPEIDIFRSAPDAARTVKSLKSVFMNKGVPEVCQSDNGPPFQSHEMREFARRTGYHHKHITPEWPRANGTVERFNRTMKKAVQAAHIEGTKLRDAAQKFVGMYRATPHSATGKSPYAAMYGGRQMRMSLPMIIEEGGIVSRQKDHQYKENMVRKNSGHHKFGVGDTVLIKQTKRNKLTPAYFPERMKVIEIKGSSLVVSDGHKTVMRDASFFKKVAEAGDDEEDDALEEEEMIPEGNNELPQPDAEESAARSPNATLDQGPNEEAPQEDDVPQESTTSSNRPRRENRRMPERYRGGGQ